MINDFLIRITNTFISWNFSAQQADAASRILVGVAVIILAILLWLISIKIVLRLLEKIVKKTNIKWDDDLISLGIFRRIARIVPALVIWYLAPTFLTGLPGLLSFFRGAAVLAIIASVTAMALRFMNFITIVYRRRADSSRRPIKGIIQAIQVLIIVAAFIVAFSAVTRQPVSGLLAGLGALSAVVMLIFKDPILGLVSGFQLTSNDMVRLGDWIEVPSQGADGDVVDISLLNVTVSNWDRTWVTFPIQSLTSSGFKNWRGMSQSGGRRIKRSLSIDMSSIHFLDEIEIQGLESIKLLKNYLVNRTEEIMKFNQKHGADLNTSPLNGRTHTNIGVFRAYAKAYVSAHPKVNTEMTLMVRQLQSGPTGLPLEMYLFSADKVWANYEDIQSDIFDHLFAALPQFGLRAYQNPTGADIEGIRFSEIPKI